MLTSCSILEQERALVFALGLMKAHLSQDDSALNLKNALHNCLNALSCLLRIIIWT